MARKSRKQLVEKNTKQQRTCCQTALYLRLSDKDSENTVSESIENQKALLLDFIESKPELELASIFIDDGRTGTNFNRPGFEQMIEAVKSGKINCIVVKDLSRFGRNYLDAGMYIEHLFPFLKVRFIAVTDGFDSLTASSSELSYLVPLKNIMNENYARDISQKERAAKKTLRQKGKFVGAYAMYGYIKSDENKHKLCIDKEAAVTVKKIFDMGEQGYSDSAIAKYLNEQEIACPARYKYEKGILHNSKYANTAGWYPQTVALILKSRIYLGDVVQGGYCSQEMKGKRQIVPEEQRDIVANQHEPIISMEQFKRVQAIREDRHIKYEQRLQSGNLNQEKAEYILKGKIFCGDCKSALVRKHLKTGTDQYRFTCEVHERNGKCSRKYFSETDLLCVLEAVINNRIAVMSDPKLWLSKQKRRHSEVIDAIDEEITVIQQGIKRLNDRKASLYQDWKMGILEKEEYLFMKEHSHTSILEKEEQEKLLQKKKQEFIFKYTEENPALKSTSLITAKELLMREIIELLIDKIEIYEHGRIKVYFRYQDEFDSIFYKKA